MAWSPRHHENLALRLDEIAASLDAGLPPDLALSPGVGRAAAPADVAVGVTEALAGAGIVLRPTETEALRAAERGGNLPSGLRRCAETQRQRAMLLRELRTRLRYPALVLLTALPVAAVAGSVTGHRGSLLFVVASVPIATAACGILAWRLARNPRFSGWGIPGVNSLLQDAGEVPYLEALGALYAAGISIVEAHAAAVQTVEIGCVRARLAQAADFLAHHRVQLTDALLQTRAVGAETLRILGAGERSGDLEAAIARALERRQQGLRRRLSTTVAVIAGVVYAATVGVVAWIVFDFYGGLYGRLHR